MYQTIQVNGKTYQEVRQLKNNSKALAHAIIIIETYGAGLFNVPKTRQLRDDIYIVEEFGKIERKVSNLSKWERDVVVFEFHQKYKEV